MSKKEKTMNIDNLERNRKRLSFKLVILLSKLITRRPKVKYTAEKLPDEPVLILSNHVARKAPMKFELYYPRDLRMWGTHEMTEGIKEVRKYLVNIYFYKKRHLPKWLAVILGTILSPLLNAAYKGFRLLPTYGDTRLLTTIKRSTNAVFEGKDIVIFPEDSSNGYFDVITKFFHGFITLLESLYRKGKDIPVFVTYFNKKINTFVFSQKFYYSKLKEQFETADNIAEFLRLKMNSLRGA